MSSTLWFLIGCFGTRSWFYLILLGDILSKTTLLGCSTTKYKENILTQGGKCEILEK